MQSNFFSDDLLLRSMRDSQSTIIPYLSQMAPFVRRFGLEDLAELQSFRRFSHDGSQQIGRDDQAARDDFLKEDKLNEYMASEKRKQRKKNQLENKYSDFVGDSVISFDLNKLCGFPTRAELEEEATQGAGQASGA